MGSNDAIEDACLSGGVVGGRIGIIVSLRWGGLTLAGRVWLGTGGEPSAAAAREPGLDVFGRIGLVGGVVESACRLPLVLAMPGQGSALSDGISIAHLVARQPQTLRRWLALIRYQPRGVGRSVRLEPPRLLLLIA